MFEGIKHRSELTNTSKERSNKTVTVFAGQSQVLEYETKGYELIKAKGRKHIMQKEKDPGEVFEDAVWSLFYKLGATNLNANRHFVLGSGNKFKQIDVFAEFDDFVYIVECKHTDSNSNLSRDQIDGFTSRIEIRQELIEQETGKKAVFIFFTSGFSGFRGSVNHQRLIDSGSLWFSEGELKYAFSLLNSYKELAYDLFVNTTMGHFLSKIGSPIKVPALRLNFAGREAFMFAMSSSSLSKAGIVPHRSYSSYNDKIASYQRLVAPKRLKKITDFVNDGGYFPNSIIVAQSQNASCVFEPLIKSTQSSDDIGMLEFSRDRALFNIIDGQHRVFSHSLSQFSLTEMLPVVMIAGIDTSEQLKLFMEVNDEQKKVSAKLRLDLEQDLNWESKYPSQRMKAVCSKIIRFLNEEDSSVLYQRIGIGDSSSEFSSMFFLNGIKQGGYLPKSRGFKWQQLGTLFFETQNENESLAMDACFDRLGKFLIASFNLYFGEIEKFYLNENQKKLLVSNRGLMVFLKVLGDFVQFLDDINSWSFKTPIKTILKVTDEFVVKYVNYAFSFSTVTLGSLVSIQGAQVSKAWSREYWRFISKEYNGFKADELEDYDIEESEHIYQELNDIIRQIETGMKTLVLGHMVNLKGEAYKANIGTIYKEALLRAEDQNIKMQLKGIKESIEWHQKLLLIDYKKIIEKFWGEKGDNNISFSDIFRIDSLADGNSKSDSTQWIIMLNDLRNSWAHAGTNGHQFKSEELELAIVILEHINSKIDLFKYEFEV